MGTLELTEVQAKGFDFIKSFIDQHRYPPSRREICEHMNWKSTTAAKGLIEALVKKKKIETIPGISRGIIIKGEKDTAQKDS